MESTSQPKYAAIHEDLRQQILDGALAAGTQLPAQQELASTYGVTLMTLRQAMGRLQAEGLVWVSRGRGSFVVDHPVTYRIGNLTSFAQQMRVQGLDLATEVLSVGAPRRSIAHARLALDLPRARLVEIHRLRRIGGRPVVSQRTILGASLAARLDLGALGEVSLYELLAVSDDRSGGRSGGRRIARALESLRAVLVGVEDATVLEQPVGSPALESIRTSLTVDGTPFLYDHALLVGDIASVEADRTANSLDLSYRLRVADELPNP